MFGVCGSFAGNEDDTMIARVHDDKPYIDTAGHIILTRLDNDSGIAVELLQRTQYRDVHVCMYVHTYVQRQAQKQALPPGLYSANTSKTNSFSSLPPFRGVTERTGLVSRDGGVPTEEWRKICDCTVSASNSPHRRLVEESIDGIRLRIEDYTCTSGPIVDRTPDESSICLLQLDRERHEVEINLKTTGHSGSRRREAVTLSFQVRLIFERKVPGKKKCGPAREQRTAARANRRGSAIALPLNLASFWLVLAVSSPQSSA